MHTFSTSVVPLLPAAANQQALTCANLCFSIMFPVLSIIPATFWHVLMSQSERALKCSLCETADLDPHRQVLQAVQKSAADSLEASILECPAGMQVLVEVLRDPREEIRNEVILLLRQVRRRSRF